ncbi:MAG: hypothetical protein KME30_32955 [Iphinoe sp. HA4291-MV1]|jgi:hypothetical protein|nr:hypothetical protein [Iphinoe sp. HA4291-MV1]
MMVPKEDTMPELHSKFLSVSNGGETDPVNGSDFSRYLFDGAIAYYTLSTKPYSLVIYCH